MRYFGTDGIRGVFGTPPLDVPFLRRLGRAAGQYFGARRPLEILIARDTRISGPAILSALAEGFASLGHRVIDLGIAPTPAVSAAVVEKHAGLGVMITASHNPAGDNGVKFFDERGLKLSVSAEEEIEAMLDREPELAPQTVVIEKADILEFYCRMRTNLLPPHALKGWVVALDTAHGATCATSPDVFRKLGAEVRVHAGEPVGANINDSCGSEHPQKLSALVRACGARVGFAHDGDGDRVLACDETGSILNGDETLGILALHALRKGRLNGRLAVTTVQSNFGLDRALMEAGAKVVRVDVGDRNVLHKLLELGASLGGENSGHFIFPEIAPCGDGLLGALMLTQVMLETGRSLSELRKEIPLLPQVSVNLAVREKKPFSEAPCFSRVLREAETALSGRGRVLARYSGTEKKLRLLAEGPDLVELEKILKSLRKAAGNDLNG